MVVVGKKEGERLSAEEEGAMAALRTSAAVSSLLPLPRSLAPPDTVVLAPSRAMLGIACVALLATCTETETDSVLGSSHWSTIYTLLLRYASTTTLSALTTPDDPR